MARARAAATESAGTIEEDFEEKTIMSGEQYNGIAIIGLAGRFPGAESVEEFWANLVAGKESISFFTDAELAEVVPDVAALKRRGHYVPARGTLKDADYFDPAFFGIHPKEAEVMDPQQRLFLEACWEALERAGYAPGQSARTVGVFAAGTVFGNGLGVIVLKRLEDAVNDGDEVYAVIKGAALNNDGSQRVSFGAPGVEGQSEVIALAHALAGVDPDTISYVEAHGTATPLGDPIEVAGLTKAFRLGTQAKQFCALGSVKTNIGHLDVAAGAAGLIKTALSLHHKIIPASLHFTGPNPKLDLEDSPFYVNAALREWKARPGVPRRAGVSSFGTGGTNAHVVLEEAPERKPSGPARPWQLLVLSAKSTEALERATTNLVEDLKQRARRDDGHGDPEAARRELADVAFTLQIGRAGFIHRRVAACQDFADAATALGNRDPQRVFTHQQRLQEPPVVFMFPGQGAQYAGMGSGLYRTEPVFRAEVDRCAEVLRPILGSDLRAVLFPPDGSEKESEQQLVQTRITQPALFVIEYALAKLWMSWGVHPTAMIGHSVGEYVAGCLAGVFTLEDGLELVARRV